MAFILEMLMTTQIIKPIPESSDRMEALKVPECHSTISVSVSDFTLSSPEALGSDSIPRSTSDTGEWKGNTTTQPRALLPLKRLIKALPPPRSLLFISSPGAYGFNQPINKNSGDLLKLCTFFSLQIAQCPPYMLSQS